MSKKQHPDDNITRAANLTGKTFQSWHVLGRGRVSPHGPLWACQCVCGTEAELHPDSLLVGDAGSCGCTHIDILGRRQVIKDLTGQVFGSWLVTHREPPEPGSRNQALWHTVCVCGATQMILGGTLRRGNSTRCNVCSHDNRYKVVVGQRYGDWCVLRYAGKAPKTGKVLFDCRCVLCDDEETVFGESLIRGSSTCCGCSLRGKQRGKVRLVPGQTFGRWRVLEKLPRQPKEETRFLCRCSCPAATERPVVGTALRSGVSQSCGCLGREVASARMTRMNRLRAHEADANA